MDSKRLTDAGWYFSEEPAFDLLVALLKNPTVAAFQNQLPEAMYYAAGANPLNQSFVTGLGDRRYENLVSQWNTERFVENGLWNYTLPPSGLIHGNFVTSYGYYGNYGNDPKYLAWPGLDNDSQGLPLYERNCDVNNTENEMINPQLCKALAVASYYLGQTSLTNQPWTPSGLGISQTVNSNSITLQATVTNVDTTEASIVWDTFGQPLDSGPVHTFSPQQTGYQWSDVEVVLPDGRRWCGNSSAATVVTAQAGAPTVTITPRTGYTTGVALTKTTAYFTLTRSSTNGSLSVNYTWAGAQVGKETGWMTGNSYSQPYGTVVFSPGQLTYNLGITPLVATNNSANYFRGFFGQKDFAVALMPSTTNAYNLGWPNSADVTLNYNGNHQ
jgi:hypothetical protein